MTRWLAPGSCYFSRGRIAQQPASPARSSKAGRDVVATYTATTQAALQRTCEGQRANVKHLSGA